MTPALTPEQPKRHAVTPGTKVTREILDALPDGSIVLTHTSGWTKIAPNEWARPNAHPGEAEYRVTDTFERVAKTVLWDATEYYDRTGFCEVTP